MNFSRDWRSGASLRKIGSIIILECDYDSELIEQIKENIPPWERAWNPAAKQWEFAEKYGRLVQRLVRDCLNEIVSIEEKR